MTLRLSACTLLVLLLVGCSGGTPQTAGPGQATSDPEPVLEPFARAPKDASTSGTADYQAPGRLTTDPDAGLTTYTALSTNTVTFPADWRVEEFEHTISLFSENDDVIVDIVSFRASPKIDFATFKAQFVGNYSGERWKMPAKAPITVSGKATEVITLTPQDGQPEGKGLHTRDLYALQVGAFYHAVAVRKRVGQTRVEPAALQAVIDSIVLVEKEPAPLVNGALPPLADAPAVPIPVDGDPIDAAPADDDTAM